MPDIEDIYPLSPTQQGLLFHSLLTPGGGLYVPQIVLSLSGTLDSGRLQTAWHNTLQRHTVLRTGFQWEQRDEPFQVVYSNTTLSLTELDWTQASEKEQTTKLQSFLAANRSEPFNLHRPPLFRVHLIRRSATSFYLIWGYHHLIVDGWSASRILQEVLQDYLFDRTIPPPRSKYSEFIAWQRKQDPAAAKVFWTNYLGDVNPQSLPLADGSDHRERVMRMGEERLEFSPAETLELKAFTQANRLTLNSLLLGSFGLVLNRQRDTRSTILGTTIAGRPSALHGVNEMVGLFINTLPVRIDIDPNQSVNQWLTELQTQLAEATHFDYVSLRDIQSWANEGRPLFDSLFVFESYPVSMANTDRPRELHLDGVEFDEWTHLPLTLLASEGDSLLIRAKFQEPRVDATFTRSLLNRVKRLLLEITQSPQARVGNIALITPDEQSTIQTWNDTNHVWPDTEKKTLVDLLEVQADNQTDAIAFEKAPPQSYATLHTLANRIAQVLQQSGIGPEHRVAVHLERCALLPTALLGILKAGVGYVPLEPSYPQSRLQTILDEVSPTVVILDSSQGLPNLETAALVLDLAAITNQAPGRADFKFCATPPHPLTPAYIIYTSGSTGRPKGVTNTHAAIVNRLLWMQQQYQLDASDRVLQKTPIGFDVSVWEFFWPLITGATLVVAAPRRHKDSEYLVETIQSQGITTLHFVPPMLDAFLEVDGVEQCKSLRRIICSGDTLSITTQQTCFEKLPHVELHNLYGPTEAAIDVTAWKCADFPEATAVPIGHPIANTTIHLLDIDWNEVPIGEEGELYIGGSGLARGYLKRPSLTAERFIPNPFRTATDPSASEYLYRTGDRARFRQDGAIEFLGRLDNQIKIRGQRIELAEIEAALAQHPSVAQALSKVHEATDLEIIAYITLKPGHDSEIETDPVGQLRPFLERSLTEAMIPRHVIVLSDFTLTTNGKIDRSALPMPNPAPREETLPPQTDTERAIAHVWQEVLHLESVGRNENFFKLGGHSLSATRANTRLRKILDIDLELREQFEHPVLIQLANHIDALRVSQKAEDNDTHVEIEL